MGVVSLPPLPQYGKPHGLHNLRIGKRVYLPSIETTTSSPRVTLLSILIHVIYWEEQLSLHSAFCENFWVVRNKQLNRNIGTMQDYKDGRSTPTHGSARDTSSASLAVGTHKWRNTRSRPAGIKLQDTFPEAARIQNLWKWCRTCSVS
jgi:hypothetical protein